MGRAVVLVDGGVGFLRRAEKENASVRATCGEVQACVVAKRRRHLAAKPLSQKKKQNKRSTSSAAIVPQWPLKTEGESGRLKALQPGHGGEINPVFVCLENRRCQTPPKIPSALGGKTG